MKLSQNKFADKSRSAVGSHVLDAITEPKASEDTTDIDAIIPVTLQAAKIKRNHNTLKENGKRKVLFLNYKCCLQKMKVLSMM